MERNRRQDLALAGLNLSIILLTGARVPLLLGLLVAVAILVIQRRLMLLAALGALLSLALMFWPFLTLFRVIDLAQLGEAANLSNRNLVWPYFLRALSASPLFGWGVGAGKVIIPVTSPLTAQLGTNAAHNEYLRLVFLGFAIHSATDNTLIATTSSVFFL